jgi:hypothetical protein
MMTKLSFDDNDFDNPLPHPTATSEFFGRMAYDILIPGIRQRASEESLRVPTNLLEAAGFSREEFRDAMIERAEDALRIDLDETLGAAIAEFARDPQLRFSNLPPEQLDEVASDALEPDALKEPMAKLALVRALMEALDLPAVTGRLYYEIVSRAGLIEDEKEGPRRAQYGTRKLRKLARLDWLSESAPTGPWLGRGPAPRVFHPTRTGLLALRALDAAKVEPWRGIVLRAREDDEVRREVERVRAATRVPEPTRV